MSRGKTYHSPDWQHYAKNKERLDKDAQALIESGHLRDVGFPEGFDLGVYAKGVVTILDKHPEAATGGLRPNGKPLSASEKRAQKRREKNTPLDGVIEVELREDQFKIIPKEDYVEPPNAPFYKNGKKMEDDWEPIKMAEAKEIECTS